MGRIAPIKNEDHIRLAELYKRYIDAYYRFIFRGPFDLVAAYYATRFRALLPVQNVGPFIFTDRPRRREGGLLRHRAYYVSLSGTRGSACRSWGRWRMDVPFGVQRRSVPIRWRGRGSSSPEELEYARNCSHARVRGTREMRCAGQRRRTAGLGGDSVSRRWRRSYRASSSRRRIASICPAKGIRDYRRLRVPLPAVRAHGRTQRSTC